MRKAGNLDYCVVFGYRLYCLQAAFAFDVFFKEKVLAVEHHVCELPYPVTYDHHARLFRQHQVEFYVAVAVNEVVDVRMRLHVLLGVPD